jgi:hypothetical protein
MLTSSVDLWEIVTIEGKGRGIVATKDFSNGTIIAMYGGVIFDQKNEILEALGYSLDMKDSGNPLAINGYHWYNLPKFAQAALTNEPNVNALPNAHIVWMNPYRNYSQVLFRIPVFMTTKDVLKGQEITVYYSGNSYLPVSVSF